jgi:Predicted membrane protein
MKRNISLFTAAVLVCAAALSMAQGASKVAMISKAEAQAIALNHAGFTIEQVTRLAVRYDIDDGRPEYEVEFYVGNVEYDYDIGLGAEEHYDYNVANPSCAVLNHTVKTGLFKGSFNLYYDGDSSAGAMLHKTARIAYTGVFTPARDSAFASLPVGLGMGIATTGKQKLKYPCMSGTTNTPRA